MVIFCYGVEDKMSLRHRDAKRLDYMMCGFVQLMDKTFKLRSNHTQSELISQETTL